MWGDGGRIYWCRSEGDGSRRANGIVVMFAWLSSDERRLKPYVDLYSSFGWNSLVCHSDFLTLFLPEKATSLACSILNELIKEVRIRSLPIIFAAFSGGPKGCMYKVLQLIEGKCGGQLDMDEYQVVKECVCGQVYDSSPVDFTSDLGTRFALHPSVIKMAHPPRVISWMAKAFASGLDTLFLNRFEAQRADYWQTLYASVSIGPFLIFCSEDDELAPCSVICNFAQRLQELGGDVRLVKWPNSPHVAHFKHHPADYKASVAELLGKATIIFSQRREAKEGGTSDGSCKIPRSVWDLHKAAVSSNESLKRVALGPGDHFFLPSSMEHEGTKDNAVSTVQDEHHLPCVQSPQATINAYGVLSQILYDVCVPKNVEGWDIKPPVSSLNGVSSSRHSPLNPIKFIRRSRL